MNSRRLLDPPERIPHKLFSHRGSEGQHLRIIDNRLFVENIHAKGWIQLNEVDTAIAAGTTVCEFEFRK